MSEERDRYIFIAKVLSQTDRIKEVIENIKKAIDINPVLELDERNLLTSAYKTIVSIPRKGLRDIKIAEENEEEEEYSQECRNQEQIIKNEVTQELIDYCNDLIQLLDSKLIPSTNEVEPTVFYYKLKGDYYRYICEVQSDDEREESVEKAKQCYWDALNLSKKQLEQYKPTALGLILNYTVFLFEIMEQRNEAIDLADTTYKECLPLLDQNSERSKNEAATILQLLKNNISLWEQTIQHYK